MATPSPPAAALPSPLSPLPNSVLPGYQVQLNEDGIRHSKEKLNASADDLMALKDEGGKPLISNRNILHLQPCTRHEETIGYRCKCTFQIIIDQSNKSGCTSILKYAMRSQHQVIPLQSSRFDIANARIQQVMSKLICSLNEDISNNTHAFSMIRMNLTSSTFVSSWDERECIVTLHYSAPFRCVHTWKEQAEVLVNECSSNDVDSHIRFIGRSKGVKIVVAGKADTQTGCEISDEISVRGERIKYIKPEGAFQHPNPRVMCQALEWILDCVDNIKKNCNDCNQHHVRLLEMYSGCGAHTMVLSNKVIGAFDKIVAVELDRRLVDSCLRNCKLNEVAAKVRVVKGDAGEYARKFFTKGNNYDEPSSWWNLNYGVLLVDPPRYEYYFNAS